MQYVLLMFMPMLISAIGGGLITDENAGKKTVGFVLVIIASLGIVSLIIWQIIDPTYYVLAA